MIISIVFYNGLGFNRVMVFNDTFNNISVISQQSVLFGGENYRPAASDWQTLSHNVVSNYRKYVLKFKHAKMWAGK